MSSVSMTDIIYEPDDQMIEWIQQFDQHYGQETFVPKQNSCGAMTPLFNQARSGGEKLTQDSKFKPRQARSKTIPSNMLVQFDSSKSRKPKRLSPEQRLKKRQTELVGACLRCKWSHYSCDGDTTCKNCRLHSLQSASLREAICVRSNLPEIFSDRNYKVVMKRLIQWKDDMTELVKLSVLRYENYTIRGQRIPILLNQEFCEFEWIESFSGLNDSLVMFFDLVSIVKKIEKSRRIFSDSSKIRALSMPVSSGSNPKLIQGEEIETILIMRILIVYSILRIFKRRGYISVFNDHKRILLKLKSFYHPFSTPVRDFYLKISDNLVALTVEFKEIMSITGQLEFHLRYLAVCLDLLLKKRLTSRHESVWVRDDDNWSKALLDDENIERIGRNESVQLYIDSKWEMEIKYVEDGIFALKLDS